MIEPAVAPPPGPMVAVECSPGFYTCADACPLLSGGMCHDLAEKCGVNCGVTSDPTTVDWEIDDPCALFGRRLVVTPLTPLPANIEAGCERDWTYEACSEKFQAFCCAPSVAMVIQ